MIITIGYLDKSYAAKIFSDEQKWAELGAGVEFGQRKNAGHFDVTAIGFYTPILLVLVVLLLIFFQITIFLTENKYFKELYFKIVHKLGIYI